MDRLTCYFDNETAVLRDCCTFDRESSTEPDDCISCREMCEVKDGECSECPIQKAFNKLAEYEDLGLEPSEIKPYIELAEKNECMRFGKRDQKSF